MLNERESNKGTIGSGDSGLNDKKMSMEELKSEIGTNKKEDINIHSMPSKFVGATQKAGQSKVGVSSGAGKKVFLGAIALILILIIVIAGVIFIFNKNNNVVDDGNQVVLQNGNEDSEEVDGDTDTNVNENTNSNTNENIDNGDNVNENVNSNTNENTDDDPGFNIDEETNFDIDNDGLSYEEELVFGTNPNLEDTDKDGYKDAQEITSLFNPLLPVKDLASSGLVIRFDNNQYNYLLLRPSTWVLKSYGGNLSDVLIIPNSETGESFTISSINNTENLSINEALINIEGSEAAANFENYSLNEKPALRSRDGRKVISIHNNYIYVIYYDTGSSERANFDSIFEMTLNSFKWLSI